MGVKWCMTAEEVYTKCDSAGWEDCRKRGYQFSNDWLSPYFRSWEGKLIDYDGFVNVLDYGSPEGMASFWFSSHFGERARITSFYPSHKIEFGRNSNINKTMSNVELTHEESCAFDGPYDILYINGYEFNRLILDSDTLIESSNCPSIFILDNFVGYPKALFSLFLKKHKDKFRMNYKKNQVIAEKHV